MKIKVEIKNMREIRAAFRKAPHKMTTELQRAINKSALQIGRRAAQNAPVDTARLRASIMGGKYKGGSYTRAESGYKVSRFRAVIGPTVNYAYWVHEGTRYMRARPFLANAVQQEQHNVDAFFEAAVKNTLDSIK